MKVVAWLVIATLATAAFAVGTIWLLLAALGVGFLGALGGVFED